MEKQNPIQHVSDTAFWIAVYRAQESERADALFHDPLASKLSEGHGQAIARQMEKISNRRPMQWSIAIRTLIIDSYIEQAIQQGVDVVLNLGAGLDTRPYRLNLPESLRWIEADFTGVVELKEKVLSAEKPRCHLQRLAVDLSNNEAREKLLAEVSKKGEKVLVLTEGVIPYLSNEDVAALANNLFRYTNFSSWVTDYFSPFFMQLYREGRVGQGIQQNAPFRFFPKNWEQFFLENGWKLKEMRFLSEEGEKVSRPAPMPFLFRIMSPFIPKSKKMQFRKMTGYALLERL